MFAYSNQGVSDLQFVTDVAGVNKYLRLLRVYIKICIQISDLIFTKPLTKFNPLDKKKVANTNSYLPFYCANSLHHVHT